MRERIAAIGVLAVAVAIFFLPLFTNSVSILGGDNLTHSLALGDLLSKALHQGGWRFWEPAVGFGFPLYADGTAGWFHPWKVFLFAVFPSLAAHDLLYVSSFFLAGLFCFLIADWLGVGPWIALTGALAVAFSPTVLGNAYNASYALALAWSGLCLLAFERWYAAPTRRRCVALAVAIALEMLASYPPLAYATLFFLGTALALRLPAGREHRIARLLGLPAATLLGVGMSAFQVVPLLELASHSVRQQAVAPLQVFPWQNHLAGLVFSNDPALYAPGHFSFFLAPLGTALALAAIAFLPLLRGRVAWSYLGAVLLCVAAAGGPGAPVFEALRALLPGFDRLRLVSPFVFVTVIPTGVVFALLLEAGTAPVIPRRQIAACAGVAILSLLLFAVSWPAQAATPHYRQASAVVLAIAAIALVGLRFTHLRSLAPLLLAAAMLVEIASLRSSFLTFFPDSVRDEGGGLASFLGARQREDPGARSVHVANRRYRQSFEGLVLQHWKSPGYADFARRCLRTRAPYLNLPDGLSFVDANDALPLAGVPALRDAIQRELRGEGRVGTRILDRLRVRWIVLEGSAPDDLPTAGLRAVWRDEIGDVTVFENEGVGPAYPWRAEPEPGTPAPHFAIPAWQRAIEALPWVAGESLGEVAVEAPAPGRVFVPISRYPGWSAFVDGERVPILPTADDVGIDVPVAGGAHRIELRFVPYSFHVGVGVAVVSGAIAIALCLSYTWVRARSRDRWRKA